MPARRSSTGRDPSGRLAAAISGARQTWSLAPGPAKVPRVLQGEPVALQGVALRSVLAAREGKASPRIFFGTRAVPPFRFPPPRPLPSFPTPRFIVERARATLPPRPSPEFPGGVCTDGGVGVGGTGGAVRGQRGARERQRDGKVSNPNGVRALKGALSSSSWNRGGSHHSVARASIARILLDREVPVRSARALRGVRVGVRVGGGGLSPSGLPGLVLKQGPGRGNQATPRRSEPPAFSGAICAELAARAPGLGP